MNDTPEKPDAEAPRSPMNFRVSERAKGLVREAIDDIVRSHGCSRDGAANLVAAVAMASEPVDTTLINDWLEEME